MTSVRIDGEVIGLGGLSRSYPFLDLARRLCVPYDKVLYVADRFDCGYNDPDEEFVTRRLSLYSGLSEDVVRMVARVCTAPWRWQFPPEGRGL